MSIADASAAPAARHHALPGGAALAIEATGLVKRFGATPALAGVDLAVAPGTVYGLLGPNGAGKTTTVRILATLLAPDGGTATVAGFDAAAQSAAVRRRIALAGQAATVDQDLTGAENLILLGRLAAQTRRSPALRPGRGRSRPVPGQRQPPSVGAPCSRSSTSPSSCST
jgi:ABC-type branched-subunit amino acid transport system ATPase component